MKTLARQRDKAEVLRRLRALRPESARRWGLMSAHQMVCHLGDGFRMMIGQTPVRPIAVPLPRTVMKWIALYVPVHWPAGRIRTSPEFDQVRRGTGTKPVDFAADVAEVETLMERALAPMGGHQRQPHPVFGPMSEADWLRWGYLHMDHHLRQFGA